MTGWVVSERCARSIIIVAVIDVSGLIYKFFVFIQEFVDPKTGSVSSICGRSSSGVVNLDNACEFCCLIPV